jgi:hypothetical protein
MTDPLIRQAITNAVIPTPGNGYPMGTADHPFFVSLAGAQKRDIGPFYVTTAASQTAVGTKFGDTVSQAWVAPRAGFITGASGMIDAAVTGAGTSIKARVYKNGVLVNAALDLDFTQAGGETTDYATVDPTLYSFAAGDKITVVYTTTAISNTPKMVVDVEVQC